jgi:hypothetical protein
VTRGADAGGGANSRVPLKLKTVSITWSAWASDTSGSGRQPTGRRTSFTVPTMLGPDERRLLYSLARNTLTDAGSH